MKKLLLIVLVISLLCATGGYLNGMKRPSAPAPVSFSFPDLVERTQPGVVHIRNNTGEWQGSGFLIAEDIVCSARHVVEGGVDFTITTFDGEKYAATYALSSVNHDVGFIKLDKLIPNCKVLQVRPITELRLGDDLFAIGSPFGDINRNAVTRGILSGVNRDFATPDYGWSGVFSTDTAGHPGNSGCPVLSMDGIVRGVLVGGHSPVMVYCVPTDMFLFDGNVVRMMFTMMRYKVETPIVNSSDEYMRRREEWRLQRQ